MIKFKDFLNEQVKFQGQIYCDSDGVLADFDKKFKELYGINTNPDKIGWSNIVSNFFFLLDKMEDANILWNYIKDFNPQILTAIPRKNSMPSAGRDKINWFKKYFNLHEKDVYVVYRKEKQNFAKTHDNYANILIDDNEQNIREWKMKGGKGILHKNARDTILQLQKIGIYK